MENLTDSRKIVETSVDLCLNKGRYLNDTK